MDAQPAPPDVQKGDQILISCSICVAVALFAVIARVVVRLKVLRNFGWDDYFMVASMILLLAEFVCVVLSVMYGAGRHVQYIDEEDFITGLHYNFATQPLSITSLCLAKVSVGLLLLRLTTTKWHIRTIWAITVFATLAWLANFFTALFQCIPMQKIWDFSTPGHCIPASNLLVASYFNSSVGGLTDLLFALLPIPLLWKVQMNRRTKGAVIAILSLGGFVTISAILKMCYLDSFGQYGDFLFDSTEITIWANVEIGTAILAACAPTLKPLFQRVLRGTTSNRSTRGYVHRTSRDEPRGYGQVTRDKKSGTQLGMLSHVTAGDQWQTESQERIVHADEDRYISKTVSVSVN